MTDAKSATNRDRRHPGLREDSRLTAELIQQYVESGQWVDRTLRDLLSAAASMYPDRIAGVDVVLGAAGRRVADYRELDARAHRMACGLASLGVRPGDSVVVMLPNCVDFAAMIFAINEIGAVFSGIPVAYGEREVEIILRRTRARVVVVPHRLRNADHLAMVRRLRLHLDNLAHVVVAGADSPDELSPSTGEVMLESLLTLPEHGYAPHDPAALAHIGFTSGTTGEPKGVMNTDQTLQRVMMNFVDHLGVDAFGDTVVNLVASPVGHHTGFLWGVLLGAYLGATNVYLDRWDPDFAATLIREQGVTQMFGAPTFLLDLMRTNLVGDVSCPLRLVVVAGAPVPRELPVTGAGALGAFICPAWGMTEWGIGIACSPRLPAAALDSDGAPIGSCEVRIRSQHGLAALVGEQGELQIRGPGLFLGYLERPDATFESIDVDGWFTTGDVAVERADGFIELRGRDKDIVIRGGENVPVVEIESLLFAHPDIVDVAVIGLPDERLGERACAVVVVRPGAEVSLQILCDYLLEKGVSKHFLPESHVTVEELPKTVSGKIRKVELRLALSKSSSGPSHTNGISQ